MGIIGLSLVGGLFATGCGSVLTDVAAARVLFLDECSGTTPQQYVQADIVVLDWTGGVSPIYPDRHFSAIDLSTFPTADGGTLADDADAFEELVRRQITRTFCDWPDMHIVVRTGEDDDLSADTIVHLTQDVQPNQGGDIGEAEYDPCNVQHDNSAIIFGERVRRLGGKYTFDEWILVFANVCAHEVAHTLGYGHIPRGRSSDTARSLFVELMWDRHTMAEMRREQRFTVDQTNCPKDVPTGRSWLNAAIVQCEASHAFDHK